MLVSESQHLTHHHSHHLELEIQRYWEQPWDPRGVKCSGGGILPVESDLTLVEADTSLGGGS